MNSIYDSDFFAKRQKRSLRSAREIVPLIMNQVVQKSVIDVGCANGTWLSVFREHGVPDVLGIDGPWVDRNALLIPQSSFVQSDLALDFPPMHKRFDLALSIEVGEHLPADRAESFVAYITALSDKVIFSAAIPGQGGDGHVNEQWQSYWAHLFDKFGFDVHDSIRPLVWKNSAVDVVHAQNILLYRRRQGADMPRMQPVHDSTAMLDIVHPRLFSARQQLAARGSARQPVWRGLASIFRSQG